MEKSKQELLLIEGGVAVDDRGFLQFANTFNFENVKRFYCVTNFSETIIRAFHGHKNEAKYVLVLSGSAIVCAVKIDNFNKPSKKLKIERFMLSAKKPAVLFIPAGYANGFRSLEQDTKVIFFSSSSAEESKNDDFRFAFDYWGKKIWEVENR